MSRFWAVAGRPYLRTGLTRYGERINALLAARNEADRHLPSYHAPEIASLCAELNQPALSPSEISATCSSMWTKSKMPNSLKTSKQL